MRILEHGEIALQIDFGGERAATGNNCDMVVGE